jgi:histidinol dehydrogenase
MIVLKYPGKDELLKALERPQLEQQDLSSLVGEVFHRIKQEGDSAVRQYAEKFDGYKLTDFFVSETEIKDAVDTLNPSLKAAIAQAAKNIETFHAAQKEEVIKVSTMPGVTCWRKSVGIDKVGLYIPGGTAPLFSTVLMLAIPAKIAGCKEIILSTPCNKDGVIHPAILFAAQLVGVTKIIKLGGIQAIAALTLGTESIDKVYKIFGPGNQYVTAAKQYAQALGTAIDMPAGPSEVMVVADESANPQFVAADLLSQAEHGNDSQVVFLSTSAELIEAVNQAVLEQLDVLPRKEFAAKSLAYAKLIQVNKAQLAEVINEYGPEHLILSTAYNDELIEAITNAGSVFIGKYTPESLGDYASGTNHTLPTNGFAKMYSGVSLDSFVKKITYQEVTPAGLRLIGPIVEKMAAAEELMAHKNAVTLRLKELRETGI